MLCLCSQSSVVDLPRRPGNHISSALQEEFVPVFVWISLDVWVILVTRVRDKSKLHEWHCLFNRTEHIRTPSRAWDATTGKCEIIESASYKLEPHKIPFYLYDLSTLFHAYWSKGNENSKFRLLQNGRIKKKDSLIYILLIAIVIKNGMKILGVSLPEKM